MNGTVADFGPLQAFAAEHHVPLAAVARWMAMGACDALALLEVARTLRMRTGQLVAAIDLVAEIALRDGANVLARSELRALVAGSGSAPGRASALLARLRELRYPALHRARARLEAEVAALEMPDGATVVLPADLGSDELQIRLSVRRPEDLETQIEALRGATARLRRILRLLGGLDEV